MIIVLTIWLGVTLASTRLFGRGFAGALMLIPAFLGAILVNTLPSHNKIGLLFSYWITSRGLFISSPSTSLTHVFPKSSLSHHLPFSLDGLDPSSLDTLNVCFIFTLLSLPLDRLAFPGTTTNAIILCAYAIGNAAGPFMWKRRYQPRYAASRSTNKTHP